jgi:AcrR family transcriptional regulator
MTGTVGSRLPAAKRRRAILDAALQVFSEGSYAGATTADIASAAGVSEPILYRHFASKRDLYFACLDEAWNRVRDGIERQLEELGLEEGWRSVAPATLRQTTFLLPNLWMQAITEAGEDDQIRRHVRLHIREAHGFFVDVVARLQRAGAIDRDRDADAEAWIFVAMTFLVAVADRLGGLLSDDGFATILAERRRRLARSS